MITAVISFIGGLIFGAGLIMWISALAIDSERVQKKIERVKSILTEGEKVKFIEPIDKAEQWRKSKSLNDFLE